MRQTALYTLAFLFATLQTVAQTYTYDSNNRLTKVVYDNGTTITYTFDALGNRTSKKVTGGSGPKEAYAWLSSNGKTLTFCYDDKRAMKTDDTYDLNTDDNDPDWNPDPWNNPCEVTNVVFEPSFVDARPTTTFHWFQNFKNLTIVSGLKYLNISLVTNMCGMFEYCSQLSSLDLSSFDTSNVTDMSWMFAGCRYLKSINLSSFNTSKVTDMSSMFMFCELLTSLDLSNFDTSKVNWFFQMFDDCSSLTSLDVSNFDTSNAVSMSSMFCSCSSLSNLDVSHFNTSKVEYMNQMFWGCSSLTKLDVSHFDTKSVRSIRGMFNWCCGLTSLDVSNFDTSNVTESDMLFNQCYGLMSLSLSSTMNKIDEDACDGVGSISSPCSLVVQEGFDLGVDTSGNYFYWKSGCFKISSSSGFASGDVNHDGSVNISDVILIVESVLGNTPSNFYAEDADLNGDGVININDVINVVNIILGEGDQEDNTAYLTCPDENHPHLIDLGLPSGTKWACCNVGATKPKEKGGYYAWGEIKEKDYYDWSTYIHCDGSQSTCHDLGDIAGTQWDVAHYQWGGSWVMPSFDQFLELLNNSSHICTSVDGVYGENFTGPNGGTIFLPQAGCYLEEYLGGDGFTGHYWSSTQYPSNSNGAHYLYFDLYSAYWDYDDRSFGYTVRPVSR